MPTTQVSSRKTTPSKLIRKQCCQLLGNYRKYGNKKELWQKAIWEMARKCVPFPNNFNYKNVSEIEKYDIVQGIIINDLHRKVNMEEATKTLQDVHIQDVHIDIVPNNIYNGDCLDLFKKIKSNSVDAVITDPPYFLDKMDSQWDRSEVHSKKYQEKSTITSLPAGMKFDPQKGKEFYRFYLVVCQEIIRILKPGGFFLSFSSPRLYHNMAGAIEDAGFYIKDMLEWLYTQNQPKAQGMNHFIDLNKEIPPEKKEEVKKQMDGWKTPQIRSNHEPICMAQKPIPHGTTMLKNFMEHGVGLINTKTPVGDNKFVSNIMTTEEFSETFDNHFLVSKPTKKEKGEYNDHKTVKPLILCRHLISLISQSNAIILDPFLGSGTTAVACKETGRRYIGFDLDPRNIEISKKRLEEVK